jgi:hypothetical protein
MTPLPVLGFVLWLAWHAGRIRGAGIADVVLLCKADTGRVSFASYSHCWGHFARLSAINVFIVVGDGHEQIRQRVGELKRQNRRVDWESVTDRASKGEARRVGRTSRATRS